MSDWRTDSARRARVKLLADDISTHLERIRDLYKDPVKITLVVRVPSCQDGSRDTTLTDDDPMLAIKALQDLFADPTKEVTRL